MSPTPTNGNQSVGKALQIVDILSQSTEPMRLQDIAKNVEMPSSTVLRMISTLAEYGYVGQIAETKRYYLTLKFAKIGSLVSSRFSIRDIAHPVLIQLSSECGEAACIAVEEGRKVIYIDVADGPDGMLKIMQRIGKQSPLHCTGVGKCLLLNYDEAQIDQLIKTMGLQSYTANTITDKQHLLDELEHIRTRGFALDDQECELGARCAAAPIRDYSGRIVAAISVSGPINRMTYSRLETIGSMVISAAARISEAMSFHT